MSKAEEYTENIKEKMFHESREQEIKEICLSKIVDIKLQCLTLSVNVFNCGHNIKDGDIESLAESFYKFLYTHKENETRT